MFKEIDPRQNFIELEHDIIDFWEKNKIIEKYLSKNNDSKKVWSFLDGPMTANNPMGVHHAWGRTLKDLWQRYYTLKGYRQRYQNGYDCQGLWVEVEVEKELGFKTKKDIEKYGVDKFVQKCKERVIKFSSEITTQSQRLAEWMHWDDSYFTMSDENNYTIWHYLKVCYENGWIYEGTDSVPWCPRCGTAISQHEILTEEYKELTHDSVYFLLPIKDEGYTDVNLLVWTTTPWTIPANVAVAADPEKIYSIVEIDGKKMILLNSRTKKVLGKSKHVKDIAGKELIGLKYKAPFAHLDIISKTFKDYEYQVVASDPLILPISEEDGTGLVHIAPGAGGEDFKLGQLRHLPILSIIDESANYVTDMNQFSGKNAKDNPEIIFDHLKTFDNGRYLYKIFPYKHRYPTCWRCKTELVWRNVKEWYISMDKPSKLKMNNEKLKIENKTYRQQMIEVAKKINWIPVWGKNRELDWLDNMHDWLISKKRYWGLALPIWQCEKCGEFEVIGSKEELKEKAIRGWEEFEGKSPHKPYIDKVIIKCEKCGHDAKRIPDVGNPWLDAGIVPFSTYIDPNSKNVSYLTDKKYWKEWFPVDFITECFPGQFKNWFYVLIAMSTALENEIPYKNLLGHALVMDENGEEMHKSKGNAIPFNEAAEKMGVDVMRWMYVSHNPVQNLNFGYTPAKDILRRFVLIFWNTYSFFVTYANVDKFKPGKIDENNLSILDKWILARWKKTLLIVDDNLSKYNSYHAAEEIELFINDLSKWYLRLSRKRRSESFYNVTYHVIKELTIVLSVFMPHISEAIYQNMKLDKDPISVHLCNWPKIDKLNSSETILEEMQKVRNVVELAHSARKEKGIKVRQPLQDIKVKGSLLNDEEIKDIIKLETNVKEVIIDKNAQFDDKYTTKEGFYLTVGINTYISTELKEEGMLRELIRQIQYLRKKAGFKALDQIQLYWDTENNDLKKMITNNLELIKTTTIASEIFNKKIDDGRQNVHAKIDGDIVNLAIK